MRSRVYNVLDHPGTVAPLIARGIDVRPSPPLQKEARMFTRLLSIVILGLALGSSQANAQVEFPSTRSSESDIKRSVESIDNFLYARSNIRLSETIKTRLVAAEQQVALGANSRLTAEQLIDVLSEVAFRRLQSLSE